ncbi:MAG: TetR/AcrR family transcriptional regulator [Desulfarculus sp.]|nr:TetR/AcrR family transcriptional regulator [Pseudomonadota bacterium]MBV1717910.1 TetR/AcrR family transcriptional regulator [Desulfarculus sp.]MBU4574466.1 TetR/AcrR family transcriptional regulator [Pseudomonadota bacterium]MBU4598102.1 TetR/AcrR family transcriptional regulator [Pseudomonadota bacterium]MBV1739860.1 TetR/AcrR family transcriptional regulator [Desulfarculus sp.]
MPSLPKGRQRQKQLYDAAARLFAAQGYHATSLRELAEALGLNKSSLYHYFDSKQELLYQLLDDYISEALAGIKSLCAGPRDPEEKLADFMRYYTRFYARDLDRLALLVNEVDNLEPRYRKVLEKKERRYLAALTDILDQLREQGRLKEVPSTVAAFAFFGMVHYTFRWYRPKGKVSPEELSEMFWEIFGRGVLRPQEGA